MTRRQRAASVGVWDGRATPNHFPDDPHAQEISDRMNRGEPVDLRDVAYLQEAIREALHPKGTVQ